MPTVPLSCAQTLQKQPFPTVGSEISDRFAAPRDIATRKPSPWTGAQPQPRCERGLSFNGRIAQKRRDAEGRGTAQSLRCALATGRRDDDEYGREWQSNQHLTGGSVVRSHLRPPQMKTPEAGEQPVGRPKNFRGSKPNEKFCQLLSKRDFHRGTSRETTKHAQYPSVSIGLQGGDPKRETRVCGLLTGSYPSGLHREDTKTV